MNKKFEYSPGPWRWTHNEWNKKVKLKRDLLVYHLQGASKYPVMEGYPTDRWDYYEVLTLPWRAIKGKVLVNATPKQGDSCLIAASPELYETLKKLLEDENVKKYADIELLKKGTDLIKEIESMTNKAFEIEKR